MFDKRDKFISEVDITVYTDDNGEAYNFPCLVLDFQGCNVSDTNFGNIIFEESYNLAILEKVSNQTTLDKTIKYIYGKLQTYIKNTKVNISIDSIGCFQSIYAGEKIAAVITKIIIKE